MRYQGKCIALFLSFLGGRNYGILCKLCTPEKPQDMTYKHRPVASLKEGGVLSEKEMTVRKFGGI